MGRMTPQEAIQQAIKKAGSQAALAEMCSKFGRTYTQPAVIYWLRVRPGPIAALDIEKATGIPRHVLRPDLYSRESAA